mgnify:CR=1 FL=1|jgi:chromosome segregation ATPase
MPNSDRDSRDDHHSARNLTEWAKVLLPIVGGLVGVYVALIVQPLDEKVDELRVDMREMRNFKVTHESISKSVHSALRKDLDVFRTRTNEHLAGMQEFEDTLFELRKEMTGLVAHSRSDEEKFERMRREIARLLIQINSLRDELDYLKTVGNSK